MPKGFKTNGKLSSYRTHFTKCFLFVETWLLDYVYYIITYRDVCKDTFNAFVCHNCCLLYLPSKETFIWSSPKMSWLNKRIESLFCKWKQFKVVNISVDMYHFCINKFTLVESAKLFLHFQLFIYWFSNSRICRNYPAHQSCFKIPAVLLLWTENCLKRHRLTLLLDLTTWNRFKWIVMLMSTKTLHTLFTKTGVFSTKIISIFLTSHLSLAASCCPVLHLLFPHPQPSEVLDISFL